MAAHTRVFNTSRNFYMKHKQAVRAVENCACAWVEFGVSLRDLTLAEAIAARHKQAQMRQPLPWAELPGVIYKPQPGTEAATHAERMMALEANQFAQLAVA